jgi:hypothetical protein
MFWYVWYTSLKSWPFAGTLIVCVEQNWQGDWPEPWKVSAVLFASCLGILMHVLSLIHVCFKTTWIRSVQISSGLVKAQKLAIFLSRWHFSQKRWWREVNGNH